jgi:hypothetical protein
MRPEGQPPSSRIVRGPSKLAFPLLGSGTTSLIRQPSPSERHIYQCGSRVAILGIATQQLLRLASSPTQLTEREVKEAAMPGQPACARALPIFPRQFTLENRRSAARLAVIIVASPEGPTFSLHSLCGRLLRVATEKHFVLVQKLWTIELPCGRLRKT